MSQLLSAVYESGVFHPTSQPHLADGEQVEIMIRPKRLLPPRFGGC